MLDQISQDRKNSLTGQMSLFDLLSGEEKEEFELRLPNVGEYEKEEKLAFEKEVLGVYISGHPLEEYGERLRKNISAVTTDFLPDEESGYPRVRDGAKEILGGMITDKTIKYTKNNKTMAFLTLEDLVGTVEVIVFPRDYERNAELLKEDSKVFIQGRVSVEEERPSKLILEKIYPFDTMGKELWIQFSDRKQYEEEVAELYDILRESDGSDSVVLYIRSEKAMKRLPQSRNVSADAALTGKLAEKYGEANVKVVEKNIEKPGKMH